MEIFWQDLRHSLRMFRKQPTFTLTVVITLALGIGANATIFTWIKAVLFDPLLGIEHPNELVEIWGAMRRTNALKPFSRLTILSQACPKCRSIIL